MSWIMALHGWQIWAFAFGIALLIAGLVFLSTRQGRGRSRQHQQLSESTLQSNKHNSIQSQRHCPYLPNNQSDFPASEVGREPKTTKTKQGQTDESNDSQDKG